MFDNWATDRAVSTAERIEQMDDPDELIDEPLDVTVCRSLSTGTITDVTLILGTGGPHVECNVSRGTVTVSWGSDRHTTHVCNDAVLDEVDRYFRRRAEETR